jgi:hypothetical protein
MPNKVVASFAKRANISIDKAEAAWFDARAEVDKTITDRKDPKYWAMVNFKTQKKLGLKEERLSFSEYAELELDMGAVALAPEPETAAPQQPEISQEEQMITLAAQLSCLIAVLFGARDIAHKLHLATKSFSQHKALEELYELLLDAADKFAEVGQGMTGFPLNLCEPAYASWSELDAVALTKALASNLEYAHAPCFASNPVLSNMLQDLQANVYRVKYKLEQLH